MRRMFSSKTLSELQDCTCQWGMRSAKKNPKVRYQWIRGGQMRERHCQEKGARLTSLYSLKKRSQKRKSPEQKDRDIFEIEADDEDYQRFISDATKQVKEVSSTLCALRRTIHQESRVTERWQGRASFLRLPHVCATEEMKSDLVRHRFLWLNSTPDWCSCLSLLRNWLRKTTTAKATAERERRTLVKLSGWHLKRSGPVGPKRRRRCASASPCGYVPFEVQKLSSHLQKYKSRVILRVDIAKGRRTHPRHFLGVCGSK